MRASARMLTFIDLASDPCEDFYQFTCGSFLKSAQIPIDKHQMSAIVEMQDDVLILLKNVLQEPIVEGELEAVKKSKLFYKSCMHGDYIDEMVNFEEGALPLLKILSDSESVTGIPKIGQWPILIGELWDESTALPLHDLVGNLLSLGTPTLFELLIGNQGNGSFLHLYKVEPPLFKEWYEDLWPTLDSQPSFNNPFLDILTDIQHLDVNGTGVFDSNGMYDYIIPGYVDYPEVILKRKKKEVEPYSFAASNFHPKARKSDSDQTDRAKNRKNMKAYKHLIEETLLFLSKGRRDLLGDVEELLLFEAHLAKLHHDFCPDSEFEHIDLGDSDSGQDDAEVNSTVKDLVLMLPTFEWELFITNLLKNSSSQSRLKLKDNILEIPVSLQCKEYFIAVFELISRTQKRTVYNYLIWRFIYNHLQSLGPRLRELWSSFKLMSVYLKDDSFHLARWKHCTARTNEFFGSVMAHMLLKHDRRYEMKNQVTHLIHEIRRSFESFLWEQDWIEPEMKEKLIEKVVLMGNEVAYPEKIFNITALEEDYSKVYIEEENFFFNVLRLHTRFASSNIFKMDVTPARKRDWEIVPFTVDAYHIPASNEVILPIGILREPFFHLDYPSFLTYPSLGVVIGHETIHGFDEHGRRFDGYGNHSSWWSESMMEPFREKVSCFVKQYSQFNIEDTGFKNDGNVTVGENLCDNGGLALAYRAYDLHRLQEPQLKLPGLSNFSDDQLFFIKFGQLWCEAMDDKGYERYIKGEVHSPGRHRANGAVMNNEAFAAAFNCPLNSPMNPEDKCILWG
ncbi:neprilysin-1-like isoform X2 [Artemia franciscana]